MFVSYQYTVSHPWIINCILQLHQNLLTCHWSSVLGDALDFPEWSWTWHVPLAPLWRSLSLLHTPASGCIWSCLGTTQSGRSSCKVVRVENRSDEAQQWTGFMTQGKALRVFSTPEGHGEPHGHEHECCPFIFRAEAGEDVVLYLQHMHENTQLLIFLNKNMQLFPKVSCCEKSPSVICM